MFEWLHNLIGHNKDIVFVLRGVNTIPYQIGRSS